MEAKHTPGPWEAVDKRPHCAGFSIFHDAQFVAFVGDSDHLTPAAANAILIAAAPELLEALQAVLRSFPTDGDMRAAGWEQTEIDLACRDYEAARAAVAKATQ